jgi:toxin CcdB
MAQFDVYENPTPRSKKGLPYLLDVQCDLLSGLQTRVVVPLARPEVTRGLLIERLTPQLEFDGVVLVMLTPEVAGVPASSLGRCVGTLAHRRGDILGALDVLLTGI